MGLFRQTKEKLKLCELMAQLKSYPMYELDKLFKISIKEEDQVPTKMKITMKSGQVFETEEFRASVKHQMGLPIYIIYTGESYCKSLLMKHKFITVGDTALRVDDISIVTFVPRHEPITLYRIDWR